MKEYLNLGCGRRYHLEWTNVDFVSTGENVIAHNLLQGIPFDDNYFEVVYHSHVLEHFSKKDGKQFAKECHRVLKKNGIIRIAIPDLEQIIREYLKNLAGALKNNEQAKENYEWIMLELYDQAVRQQSGGDMAEYIFQKQIPNEEYVFQRIGAEGILLREQYLKNKNNFNDIAQIASINNSNPKLSWVKKIKFKIRKKIKDRLFKHEFDQMKENDKYVRIGKFRLGGEIHQWMYDRYSLKSLLEEVGFGNVEVKTAFESNIPNWDSFELEAKNGIIHKPDSLFVEAIKG